MWAGNHVLHVGCGGSGDSNASMRVGTGAIAAAGLLRRQLPASAGGTGRRSQQGRARVWS
ncbi:hypothetical protein XHV734_1429 [Xanthomonas hortorum pv. vitians]|nr:hypothetical protein XHV734_1429 [Xanthomonas hortorum pv. vitians]